MSAYSEMPRGSAYAADPDYDALQCRHVRTTTAYDFARVDDRTVAEPDALINEQEHWERAPYPKRPSRKPAAPPVNALQERVVAHMAQFGSSTIPLMAHEFDMQPATLHKHLTRREGYVYCRLDTARKTVVWGLVE